MQEPGLELRIGSTGLFSQCIGQMHGLQSRSPAIDVLFRRATIPAEAGANAVVVDSTGRSFVDRR